MQCPGQDTKYWKSNAIYDVNCPKCGTWVEFFKDDTTRKCIKCNHRFLNPYMDFGCASYCNHALECIGQLTPELIAQKKGLLKDRVAIEIKKYFRNDFQRISHAIKIARHAEYISKNEENSNITVVICSGYLQDLEIIKTKKKITNKILKNEKNCASFSARIILEKLKAKPELIDEICNIISNNDIRVKKININYKILHDANMIASMETKYKNKLINFKSIEETIKNNFMTNSGENYARKILLK